MKRALETGNMDDEKTMLAYDNLKTLKLVDAYFLKRALELCPAGKVLDVGCGTGRMLRQIKGDYALYGVDISKKLVEYAKKKGGRIRYRVASSDSLPYETGYFDLVMCHSLFHHLKDPSKTINELLRVVKPDGAVFIRDLIRPANEDVLKKLFLGYLAAHYDELNKKLFEESLRGSFSTKEWQKMFPKRMTASQVFFYNVAERCAKAVKLDKHERKVRELEFALKRLIEPIVKH